MVSHNIDFMWLARGHTPDHTTLSQFRAKFGPELKDLFRGVGGEPKAVIIDSGQQIPNKFKIRPWRPDS